MSGKAVRETLAALGVIASLVFVGVEIQQNTTVARAATRQALADQALSLQSLYTQDDGIAREFWRFLQWEGDPPEDIVEEFPRVRFLVTASILQRENVFIQAQEGIVDEAVLQSYGWNRGGLFRSELFGVLWASMRSQYDPDFVAAFEAEYDLAP